MKQKKFYLPLIILTGFLLRIYFLLNYTDIKNLDFYEYGAIAENIHNGNGYALFYFDNDKLEIGYNKDIKAFKSAFMPPGYVTIIYIFYFINDIEIRNYSTLLFQILVSLLTIFILFHLTKEIFNYASAVVAASIAAVLPEFIYASCSPGTTVFFHCGVVLILFLLLRAELSTKNSWLLVFTGLAFGILTLFRAEFILFLFMICIFYLTKKQFNRAVIIFFMAGITIIPWGIRNTIVFNDLVPLSTSSGLNFYRGHNPYGLGVWADKEITDELLRFKDDPEFEIKMNKFYINRGIENIVNFPLKELEYALVKIFHLWIFNPQDGRTSSVFYNVPWIVLLITFLIGIQKSFSWQKQKYILLFLIYFFLVVLLFFCLSRYQTMMKIALIPYAGNGLIILANRLTAAIQNK